MNISGSDSRHKQMHVDREDAHIPANSPVNPPANMPANAPANAPANHEATMPFGGLKIDHLMCLAPALVQQPGF